MTTASLAAVPLHETDPGPRGAALDRTGLLNLHRDRVRLRGVCVAGVNVGSIVNVMLDADARRVAGFSVRLADGDERFVPLVAVVALGPCGIELDSALHLMRDVAFYEVAGMDLGSLLGRSVGCRHAVRGSVGDVIADLATGDVIALELVDGTVIPRDQATFAGDTLRVACVCR